jgi:hypothetical protein
MPRLSTAAIAAVFARAFPASPLRVDGIEQVALFCAVGLLVSLLAMTDGLDLGIGFFQSR